MNEYISKSAAYNAIRHEAETHMLPASKEAYERAARIISMIRPESASNVPLTVKEKEAAIKKVSVFDCKCSNCGSYTFDTDKYCPECGVHLIEVTEK